MNFSNDSKSEIYCCVWRHLENGVVGMALADNGVVLAIVNSSNAEWAKSDLGFDGSIKNHDNYKEHFGLEYKLIWLDEPCKSEEFGKALSRNHAQPNYYQASQNQETLKFKAGKPEKKSKKVETLK